MLFPGDSWLIEHFFLQKTTLKMITNINNKGNIMQNRSKCSGGSIPSWSVSPCFLVQWRISRKGRREDCEFRCNDKSWRLWCSNKLNRWSFRHNNKSSVIIANSSSSNRAGVYVDVSTGSLSFYSVSDTHTHTLDTTFTEPLYAGFRVGYGFSVSLCDIKQPPVRIISDPQVTR